MVRCEFGPSSCRRLAQRLRGMLAGDDWTIASGCTDRSERVVDRRIGCSFQLAGRRPRGSHERGRRVVDAAAFGPKS
jgi:hypothetical protein